MEWKKKLSIFRPYSSLKRIIHLKYYILFQVSLELEPRSSSIVTHVKLKCPIIQFFFVKLLIFQIYSSTLWFSNWNRIIKMCINPYLNWNMRRWLKPFSSQIKYPAVNWNFSAIFQPSSKLQIIVCESFYSAALFMWKTSHKKQSSGEFCIDETRRAISIVRDSFCTIFCTRSIIITSALSATLMLLC